MLKKYNIKDKVIDYTMVFIGTAIYSIGVSIFIIPADIGIGGLTGIGAIVFKLTGFPVGTTTLLLNIPLIISGFLLLGRSFIIKSMFSVALFTLFSDVILVQVNFMLEDRLLCCIFGGILMGLGIGMLYARDSSSGGSDIANRMLLLKYPHMQIGKLVMITDGVIIGVATLVFGDIAAALYAIVVIFIQSRLIDYVVYGLEKGKMVMIITSDPKNIQKEITSKLKRGCTIINGKGGYSDDSRDVILCAVRRNEFYRLKNIVKNNDEYAFVIVTDASEVLGEGFESKVKL